MQLLLAGGAWGGLAIENARSHANLHRLALSEGCDRPGIYLRDGIIQSIYGIEVSLDSIQHLSDEDLEAAREGIQHALAVEKMRFGSFATIFLI